MARQILGVFYNSYYTMLCINKLRKVTAWETKSTSEKK